MEDITKTITKHSEEILKTKDRLIIAIDGRCGSGKTTVAAELSKALGAVVFHMDDFYLRREQRTEKRLAEPGGNVDRERFLEEVLKPLSEGEETIDYRPFDCGTFELADVRHVPVGKIVIVEGSYSCHPELFKYHDLHIFLTISRKEQEERILRREGAEKTEMFKSRWIPMEERYFDAFYIEGKCEIVINNGRYGFYGMDTKDVPPVDEKYAVISDQRVLYDLLSDIWCPATCAPRMRSKWSPENKTLGQCSVTAFLAQDIFGGKVYGIPLPEGGYHCFNKVGDVIFDLTSEQFGDEKLDYNTLHEQSRDVHFAKKEKYERYLLLKEKLEKRLNSRLSQ